MGTLYVVATPIGNMEDLSPRALRVLSEVDLIAAEDTRHTGAMLNRLGISTPMISNHGFNERSRVDRILEALERGDVALVSDSGTPTISDPGSILVRAAAEAGFDVSPVPGASALVAAVSTSGLVQGPFVFLGFLPRTIGERLAMLRHGLSLQMPLVLYETGPRIVKLMESLAELAPESAVVVFRELTKLHEEAFRDCARSMPSRLSTATLKGEFVVVIEPMLPEAASDIDDEITARLRLGERPADIARDLARQSGEPRSSVYERILRIRGEGEQDQGA